MRDLHCDPSTFAGPIDQRVVQWLSRRRPLDADYLACMETSHGGVPLIGSIRVGATRYKIARFLTLLDEESELSEPFRPHFEQSTTDERAVNSISYLTDYEHATSRALFGLMPFATTQDGMCLDRAYVDLFCFDYRDRSTAPQVALWIADVANDACLEWDQLPAERQFDDDDNYLSVPWTRFVAPLARNFAEFVDKLEPVA
jgi:hypothetical protein